MKGKLKLSVLIGLAFLLFLVVPVHGYSFNFVANPNKTVTSAGDIFTVTLSMENLNVGASGTKTLMGALEYDENTLEVKSFEGLNSWTVNFQTREFAIERSKVITEDMDIAKITFAVKSNAELGTTDIKLKNVSISVNREDKEVPANDQTVTMDIKSITTKNENYTINTDTIRGVSPSTKVSEFKSYISGNITVKDKDGNTVADDTFIGTGMVITNGTETYEVIVKGDLNGDGLCNHKDLAKMRMHIIKLSVLEGAYLKATDINLDGNLANVVDFDIILDVFLGLRTI